MHKVLLSIILCVAATVAWAQDSKPKWLELRSRQMAYPVESYVVGFVQGEVRPSEADAIVRMKQEAAASAAASLRTIIQSTSELHTHQDGDDFNTTFNEKSAMSTNLELSSLNIEHYVDAATQQVFAIAYAKRSDLAAYYQTQISLNMGNAEALLQTAAELEQVSKMQSRKYCARAKEHLEKAKYAQEMAAIVQPNSRDAAITEQYARLAGLAERLWEALISNIAVYVESNEDVFTKPSSIAATKVKAGLSDVEWCSFAQSRDDADYILTINATATVLSEGTISYCVANIDAELVDMRKNKSIYNGVWDAKGGHAVLESAARQALTKAADKASADIINHFKGIKK